MAIRHEVVRVRPQWIQSAQRDEIRNAPGFPPVRVDGQSRQADPAVEIREILVEASAAVLAVPIAGMLPPEIMPQFMRPGVAVTFETSLRDLAVLCRPCIDEGDIPIKAPRATLAEGDHAQQTHVVR